MGIEKAKINVTLDDKTVNELVEKQIRLAIGQSLAGSAEQIIEKVVGMALNAKESSYSSETFLMKAVNTMIQETAKSAFTEFVQSKKDTIKTAVIKRLKNEEQFIDTLAEKIVSGLAGSFYVDCKMKIE
jgi:predicted HNH restriction endonuclease